MILAVVWSSLDLLLVHLRLHCLLAMVRSILDQVLCTFLRLYYLLDGMHLLDIPFQWIFLLPQCSLLEVKVEVVAVAVAAFNKCMSLIAAFPILLLMDCIVAKLL